MTVGAAHVSPITEAVVIEATFARVLGGSGFVMITAPLPGADATEDPTAFVAITVA